jgi:Flp pilus assembly protein TadG
MKIPSELHEQAHALLSGLHNAIAPNRARIKGQLSHPGVCGWFRNGSEGYAIVEVAILLPVLMLIMTGIFAFGLAISNQLTLTQALGTGAQYLQQIRTSTTDPCNDTFTAIKNAAPYLNSSNITVTVTMNGVTPTQIGNTCAGAQSNLTPGVAVSVNATYPCTLAVYSMNFASSCQLSAKVTEYEY